MISKLVIKTCPFGSCSVSILNEETGETVYTDIFASEAEGLGYLSMLATAIDNAFKNN